MRRSGSHAHRAHAFDLRAVAVVLWAVAGSFVAGAFLAASVFVEAACGAVAVLGALAIARWAMPPWEGTRRTLVQVVILAAVQSMVIIALVVAFGR